MWCVFHVLNVLECVCFYASMRPSRSVRECIFFHRNSSSMYPFGLNFGVWLHNKGTLHNMTQFETLCMHLYIFSYAEPGSDLCGENDIITIPAQTRPTEGERVQFRTLSANKKSRIKKPMNAKKMLMQNMGREGRGENYACESI
jgi:hypothetical protein